MTIGGFELELLYGVSAALAAEATRVPLWDQHSQGGTSIPAGKTIIAIGPSPAGVDSVALMTYTVMDEPTTSDSTIGVQVTIRCTDTDKVNAIADDLFDALQGRPRGMLGTVTLVSAARASGTSLGQDSTARQGRSENYYLTVWRPSTHRQ